MTWTVSYPSKGNGRGDGPVGVAGDPNGDIVVAVAAAIEGGSGWCVWKYDSRSGAVLWGPRRFGGDPLVE